MADYIILYIVMFSVKFTESQNNLCVISTHFEHMSMFIVILSPNIYSIYPDKHRYNDMYNVFFEYNHASPTNQKR